ncbi:hypothetical protein ACTL6U_06745 [Rhodovibrionaceae bacterium A322]
MIKTLVAVLGVVILVLMGFVVWGVVRQAEKLDAKIQDQPGEAASKAALQAQALKQREKVPALVGFQEGDLDIPYGCRVEAAEPLGEHYALLRIDGSLAKGCKQVLVVDLKTLESRVRLNLPRKAGKAESD